MFAAEIQEKTNTTNMSGTGMRVDVDSSMKYFNDVNKQEQKLQSYFGGKFKNHLMDKVRLRSLLDQQQNLTSTASLKRYKIINDLGQPNSQALEMHKLKLERRTLKNYESVLVDLQEQIKGAGFGKNLERINSSN